MRASLAIHLCCCAALLRCGSFAVGASPQPSSAEQIVTLDAFGVEAEKWSKPWFVAQTAQWEILTNASRGVVRDFFSALVRGQRLLPNLVRDGSSKRYRLIVVDEPEECHGLGAGLFEAASSAYWYRGVSDTPRPLVFINEDVVVVAINVSRVPHIWQIEHSLTQTEITHAVPRFPDWVTTGLAGDCGALGQIMGVRNSQTVKFAKLPWPEENWNGSYPPQAEDLPSFSAMFDPVRDPAKMAEDERRLFVFQTGLFVRWSLFGPAKNGRNRNGFWAFAELARHGRATEAVFRECYGMDWSAAQKELKRYLNSKGVGVLEARMPDVMAPVREAERLEFRAATREDVRRLVGELNRLRAAEAMR